MGSEAKKGTLPATVGTLCVDPDATFANRFLRCGPSLQPFLSWVQPQHPRTLRHQDITLLALGRVCPLMQKTPCEPSGGQVLGMQLGLSWAWI